MHSRPPRPTSRIKQCDLKLGSLESSLDMSDGDAGCHGPRPPRSKTFNDPIHGHFDLQDISVRIIDTPEFQRLRYLKQLGLTYYVFPGATHCRFEHSLGVANLAAEWGRQLISKDGDSSSPESKRKTRLLELAGLCHDLGHGPFSHVFENELLPRIRPSNAAHWSHEDMSTRILCHLLDSNHIDLPDDDVVFVQQLVAGTPLPADPDQRWLFDIVANKRNGIDVDKFDYLKRDSHCTGVKISLDYNRILHYSRIAGGQVVFKWSEYENLYRGVFQERATMHSKVYTHRKAKGIEFLVCDALAAAKDELNLAEAADDVKQFLALDDGLLRTLQLMNPDRCEHSAGVRKAQALIRRLNTRDLYAYCDEVTVPPGCEVSKPRPEDITSCQSTDGLVNLKPEDIIISTTAIDCAMKHRNPLDSVLFYNPGTELDVFPITQQAVSSLFGANYQDHKIRVYSKVRGERIQRAVTTAFRVWVGKTMGSRAVPCTPSRDSKKRRRSLDFSSSIPEECSKEDAARAD